MIERTVSLTAVLSRLEVNPPPVVAESLVAQAIVANLAAASVEEILPGAIVWERDVYPLIKRGKVQDHWPDPQKGDVT